MENASLRGWSGWMRLALYAFQRELERRYAGSLLGVIWAFIFPAIQICLYAAVLHFGLRLQPSGGASLPALLIAGMVPWFAFNEALTSMTTSITSNASLIKHLTIPTALLPIACLMAAGAVHGVMILLASLALALLGFLPGLHLLTLFYYLFCLALMTLATGVLLSIANAAFRDISHAIGPVLGLWFWATPIIWPVDRLPASLQWVVAINPFSYIVAGYRSAFLGPQNAPMPNLNATLAFWAVTGAIAFAAWQGARLFRRELADFV